MKTETRCFMANSKCIMIPLNNEVGVGRIIKGIHVDDCPDFQPAEILVLTSISNSRCPQWIKQ